MTKADEMMEIEADVLNLTKSPLYNYRIENNYFPVVGEGSVDAKIMFVGEAPGKNEAKTGRPFCGAAGKILDLLLSETGIVRESVYITSIVKDRPQNNRDPLPKEIECYAPFLDRQIETIQPKVIATLGRYSMEYIMTKYGFESEVQPIGKLHGRTFKVMTSYGEIDIVVLYHPAAAIYNRKMLDILKSDFKLLKKYEK